MSWLFSFLLVCYVLVRIVMRVRGQLRWFAARETLPVPPAPVEAPAHLSPTLAGVFTDARELRIELARARRLLAIVQLTDPDAPLGRVRDARYRRALMQSFSLINAWLRGIHELPTTDAATLDDMHIGPAAIEQLRDGLRDKWREAAHARALDLFEIADLRAVEHTLERIDEQLAALEHGLGRLGDDPYRDRSAA